MSSSFFYSQDHDCSVCSSSLHPDLSSPSVMSAWEDVSSIIDLYWDEDEYAETSKTHPTTTKTSSTRPSIAAHQIPDRSITATPSAVSSSPSLLSSSASTITSTSSSSSTSSLSSRRRRLKKAISNLSLRHKSSDHDLALRSAKSEDGRTPFSDLPPLAPHLAPDDARTCGTQSGIHPYNFFEASLYLGPDYSIFEDGWLRLRTESRLR